MLKIQKVKKQLLTRRTIPLTPTIIVINVSIAPNSLTTAWMRIKLYLKKQKTTLRMGNELKAICL
jgi:hypothetical protein